MSPAIERRRSCARLAVWAFGAATLVGCATHPKPAPAPTAVRQAPPPVEPPMAPMAPGMRNGPAPGSAQDFVVSVGDRVYFDYDQYTIRPDAQPVLAAQAAWLIRYPSVRVRIEGNADERGTREYNFALGARRADAVKDFLTGHGVGSSRITTVSYGKDRPIDGGEGEAAWQHNRNAHTAITDGAR